jgi:hypothetical protein
MGLRENGFGAHRPPDFVSEGLGHLPRLKSSVLETKKETLVDRVGRAKSRWLKRVMYETSATSTEKCFAYSVADHLNCVTLDCWPSQARFAKLLGFKCNRTVQRAARGLAKLGVLTLKRVDNTRYRYAPVFLPGDEDKKVPAPGQLGAPVPDRDVRESLLPIQNISSEPTEVVADESKRALNGLSTYRPAQRGAIEMKIAELLGRNGIDVLAKLEEFDAAIVDRLCRAYFDKTLGERELAAARLAADQM